MIFASANFIKEPYNYWQFIFVNNLLDYTSPKRWICMTLNYQIYVFLRSSLRDVSTSVEGVRAVWSSGLKASAVHLTSHYISAKRCEQHFNRACGRPCSVAVTVPLRLWGQRAELWDGIWRERGKGITARRWRQNGATFCVSPRANTGKHRTILCPAWEFWIVNWMDALFVWTKIDKAKCNMQQQWAKWEMMYSIINLGSY